MLKEVHKRLNIRYGIHALEAAKRGHLVDDEDADAFTDREGDGPTLDSLIS